MTKLRAEEEPKASNKQAAPHVWQRTIDAGYQSLPIGAGKHRWPTMVRSGKDGVRTFALGIIGDTEPLWLKSARKYAEVLPELLRSMPVPGMLEAFEVILNNPLVYLESDPAYGKSYLAQLVGNAMHPEGAVPYDAGSNGGNLESLLFQTVFDSNANSDLIDRINSALKNGTLTEPSLKALRELKIVKGEGENQVEIPLLSEEGRKKVFDWNGLRDSGISRKKIDSVLTSIQKYQEWNGGLRIGFKDVPGALIVAAQNHRPLIIDEFARRKEGSEAALQQIWQCIAGEKGFEKITIPLGNLGEFTLHTGDIPRVIMTSNKPKDGAGVIPLPDSLASRFVKKSIPAFSEDDWAHRISQALTGVPITTLSRLETGKMASGPNKEDAKWIVEDKAKFRRNLESIRTTGVPAVPPLQMKLIEHWQDVIDVSKALGRAFHKSAALLDPSSPLMQRPDMGGIRTEVDDPGDPAKKLTPRDALRELAQAIDRMAHKVPATETKGADFTDWNQPEFKPSKEPIEAKLGDRMKAVMERWIDDAADVTIDGAKRPKLYAQLKKIWEEAGITGADSVLNQLNIASQTVEATSEDTKKAKAIIDNLLKVNYPDYAGVSPQAVEAFLRSLENRPPRAVGEEKMEAQVLSSDADNITGGQFTEMIAIASRPQDQTKPGGASVADFMKLYPPEILMEQDNAISTLALPYVGKELLQAISKLPDGIAPVPAASYTDKSPLIVTTTIAKTSVGGKDAYAKLHVLHNKDKGTTLVIATAPPSVKLADNSLVTVVDASRSGAEKAVKKWLKANADGMDDALRTAFEIRNAVPDDKKGNSLESILTDKAVKAYSPTMLDGRKIGRAKG